MPVTPLVHVVDDDEAVRDSLTLLLESAGFGVRSYASAGF
jgi:two-component system response regulator FixJ